MASSGMAPPADTDPLVAAKPQPSVLQLVMMTIFSLPMAVIWSTTGLVVLPAEAVWLFPTDESFFLGVFLVVVGVSQLVCPIAGLLSDRHRSHYGRRRPFIVCGTMCCAVGVMAMRISSLRRMPGLFLVSLFWAQIALNVVYSAQASIVPDFCDNKKGEASGVVAGLMFCGNLLGMIYVLASSEEDFHHFYLTYVALLVIATVLVCFTIKEQPTDDLPPAPQLTARTVVESYWMDLSDENRDFFWVFIGRTFYYMSTACQTFMYYYLRDLVEVSRESVIRWRLGMIVIIAMTVGLCVSYPVGLLSDRVGRKPLVYLACGLMAFVYLGFCLSPLLGSVRAMACIYLLAGVYGVGTGCYQSVDYALALDCLPEEVRRKMAKLKDVPEVAPEKAPAKGSSEALGLWGISGFLGSALGPMLGGTILEVMGGWGQGGHYTYPGYVVMLSMGGICSVLSAYFTSFIEAAK